MTTAVCPSASPSPVPPPRFPLTQHDALQDILPLVPTTYPVVVLDAILSALTHTNPIRRRFTLGLVLLAAYLALQVALVSRAALNAPRVIQTPAWVHEDDLARRYVAEPPSDVQKANHARLVDLIESRSSAYSPALFSLRSIWSETSPVVGVSAVLLHWKRRKGLELVVSHISRYPFIREIIIWNNHPGVDLKSSVRGTTGGAIFTIVS